MQDNTKNQHTCNEKERLRREREKRLQRLQDSIQNGTYDVSGVRIAKRMLQKEKYKNVIPWNSF